MNEWANEVEKEGARLEGKGREGQAVPASAYDVEKEMHTH